MKKDNTQNSILNNMSPLIRTILGLVCAGIAVFLGYKFTGILLLSAVFGWISFALAFLAMDWMIIFKRSVPEIKAHAKKDDGSVAFVFFTIIVASLASMVAVLMLTTSKDSHENEFSIPAAVIAMILAWTMVHTQYIFHYAHEYYDDEEGSGEVNRGLDFPNDDAPDYLDFAYYSFCMGCTFQVSDIDVTSKLLRRITMVHGLLAFFMNTFVVALTINLVAGLSN